MLGPIFFALSQIAIERGFRAGMIFNLGVWLSDCIYITIVYLGVVQFADLPNFRLAMGIIGGSILMCFGLMLILRKGKAEQAEVISLKDYRNFFLKGVIINSVNPFVLFLWIYVSGIMIERDMSLELRIFYFSSILGTVAFFDILKTLLAKKLREYLKTHHLVWVRRISGAGLVFFGIYIIVRIFMENH